MFYHLLFLFVFTTTLALIVLAGVLAYRKLTGPDK